jgi:hypothetical protein
MVQNKIVYNENISRYKFLFPDIHHPDTLYMAPYNDMVTHIYSFSIFIHAVVLWT